ncbi:MAG: hypothetical protein BroJett030_30840 [Alphaproteobacteria bacterium]|nr:MAG: hypothetical protein BroJett030_30840 [Alphaproteobacteria bacterium]
MKTAANFLAAAAFVVALSVASLAGTTKAEAFFQSWKGLSGTDLGSGR